MEEESKPVECYEQVGTELIECGRVQNKLVICNDPKHYSGVSQNVRNALKEEERKKNDNSMYNFLNF